MKTNVNLVRKLDRYDVIQRSLDGMFNATSLLKQWNMFNNQDKRVENYLRTQPTKEFIDELIKEECLDTPQSVCRKSKASKGVNAGTWMHPLLFLDFAMWLNPRFKIKVLKFVHDQLIEYRNKIGDSHKPAMNALKSIYAVGYDYSKINKAINCVVFGKHEKYIRNTATIEHMQEVYKIHGDIDMLVSNGYVNSVEGVMNHLRMQFNKKYNIPF